MTVLYNGNTSITGNITSLGGLVPPSGVISSIFSNSLHLSSNNGNPVYLNYGNAGTNYGSIPAFIIGNGQGGSNTSISYSGVITCISVTQSSDLRLKTNITQLRDSLSKVTQIKGISFNWKEENRGLETQIGVIAQEVEAFWPELVTNNYNGFKSVNYSGLIAPIIEAVKEQQAQINNLGVVNIENFKSETKTQNQELTTKIETLTGEVGVLKSENIATKTETANFGIELTKSKTELGELKSQFETGKTEITNLKNELTTLKTEKSEIVAKNQTQQTQIDNLEAKNLETKTDLAKVTRENQTLKTSLETLENVNKTTKTDLENLKTEIEKIKLFVNFAS